MKKERKKNTHPRAAKIPRTAKKAVLHGLFAALRTLPFCFIFCHSFCTTRTFSTLQSSFHCVALRLQ